MVDASHLQYRKVVLFAIDFVEGRCQLGALREQINESLSYLPTYGEDNENMKALLHWQYKCGASSDYEKLRQWIRGQLSQHQEPT